MNHHQSKIFGFLAIALLLLHCSGTPVTRVTAHRGASGSAPENTLASLQKAIRAGADFSEIDVQETADGRIILLHDETLGRTTDGKGPIWLAELAELSKLDAGSWFAAEYSGEKLPLLETVIDSIDGKMKLNIELKVNGHEQKLVQRVVEILKNKRFTNQCIITSFDFETIQKAKHYNPKLRTGFIFGYLPEDMDIFTAPVKILSVHKNLATAEFIAKAHKAGKKVHVWTVNDSTEMRRLIDLKADNIITNYPEKLRKIIISGAK